MTVESLDGRPDVRTRLVAAARRATLIAIAAAAPTASAVPVCVLINNGSFTEGLAGWITEPTIVQMSGSHSGSSAAVVPGDGLLVPMDEHVARLSVFANAGVSQEPLPGGSVATASMSLRKTATVTDRFLRFTRAGGWEAVFFAEGQYGFDLSIIVHGPGGSVVSQSLDSFDAVPGLDCDMGMSILGVFKLNEPEVFLDLLTVAGKPSGISPGDEVEIELRLSCLASATGECDEAEMYAVLYVDQFQFCDDKPVEADLNGDGSVNTLDLGILLASWSIPDGSLGCQGAFPCPADLDDDYVVNSLDLGILLSSWTLTEQVVVPRYWEKPKVFIEDDATAQEP